MSKPTEEVINNKNNKQTKVKFPSDFLVPLNKMDDLEYYHYCGQGIMGDAYKPRGENSPPSAADVKEFMEKLENMKAKVRAWGKLKIQEILIDTAKKLGMKLIDGSDPVDVYDIKRIYAEGDYDLRMKQNIYHLLFEIWSQARFVRLEDEFCRANGIELTGVENDPRVRKTKGGCIAKLFVEKKSWVTQELQTIGDRTHGERIGDRKPKDKERPYEALAGKKKAYVVKVRPGEFQTVEYINEAKPIPEFSLDSLRLALKTGQVTREQVLEIVAEVEAMREEEHSATAAESVAVGVASIEAVKKEEEAEEPKPEQESEKMGEEATKEDETEVKAEAEPAVPDATTEEDKDHEEEGVDDDEDDGKKKKAEAEPEEEKPSRRIKRSKV